MRKALVINLSPRKDGTSAMLGKMCADALCTEVVNLYGKDVISKEILPAFSAAEIVVVSGPCYINTYPAETIRLLEQLAEYKQGWNKQKFYAIINGGMPYVHTHESGLHMIEEFCNQCDMFYQGGFIIGLGPMLNGQTLEKHMGAKKIVPNFHEFIDHMVKGEVTPSKLYQKAEVHLPNILERIMAMYMNRQYSKKVKKYGLNPKVNSPYANNK